MDEQSQQGHLDSIALSLSYVLISANDEKDQPPRNTVESPFQVWARRDPKTRKVTSAIKKWKDEDDVAHALVFTPMETQEFVSKSGMGAGDSRTSTTSVSSPWFPLVNRPRILRPDGRSEFVDIIPLADAANKMATDMMVSGEFHAMPRRWPSA
ncbi:phage portal protein [Rhodococcus hoagii]|nr:phage portal protein [Prescottella equi]